MSGVYPDRTSVFHQKEKKVTSHTVPVSTFDFFECIHLFLIKC